MNSPRPQDNEVNFTHHPPTLALNDEACINASHRVVTPDTSLEGERGRGVRAVRPTPTSRCVRWGRGMITHHPPMLALNDEAP